MAGVIMVAMAAMRVGSYIRLIPHSVIVGFTAGIAVIIAVSQFGEMLGLRISHEPVDLNSKIDHAACGGGHDLLAGCPRGVVCHGNHRRGAPAAANLAGATDRDYCRDH